MNREIDKDKEVRNNYLVIILVLLVINIFALGENFDGFNNYGNDEIMPIIIDDVPPTTKPDIVVEDDTKPKPSPTKDSSKSKKTSTPKPNIKGD